MGGRCIIPADGFYECQRTGRKHPFYLCIRDEGPFSFAGPWEMWEG